MGEVVEENCGLVVAHSLHDVVDTLKEEQHRGQEAAGIACMGNGKIDGAKWTGLVDAFELDTLHTLFPPTEYHTYAGHIRYATRGRKDKLLQDAHPHVIGGTRAHVNNHVIIRNARMAIVHNGQVDDRFLGQIDRSLLETDCDSEALLHLYKEMGEMDLLRAVPGSYSAIILDAALDKAIIIRDRHGIKPLWLAKKDGIYIAASEDSALQENGATVVRRVVPGEAIYLSRNGGMRSRQVVESDYRHCFFEQVYIQSPDSEGVREARRRLGEMLASEFRPDDIDIVTFTPRCPEPIAHGYAQAVGKDVSHVFYKPRLERSFLQSTQEERENSITGNLYLVDNADLAGKAVAVVDDSLVRGTVVKRAVRLLKDAGASKVYYILATPPLGVVKDGEKHGCLYGVDMPPDDNFAVRRYGDGTASQQSIAMMERASGADKIFYISEKGLFSALRSQPRNSCYHCIGGPKPF